MPRQWIVSVVIALALSGCGGQYILTVPDQVANPGGQVVAVARLQRNDFFVLAPPIQDAAIRFFFTDGPDRGAYTDRLGYAGVSLPAPAQPGQYVLNATHLDREGDQAATAVPAYIWDAKAPAAAVDLAALPDHAGTQQEAAKASLAALKARSNIIYLTDEKPLRHAEIHRRLADQGYPDGPVLLWQREFWHVTYASGWIPVVKIETRLVSQLGVLRQTLPKLAAGITRSPAACKTFLAAGMRCLVLGHVDSQDPKVVQDNTWQTVEKAVP